ncbi:endolytic transglycosylase MltG [Leucobacter insecticola]|uniref:endolytic transglycosylase MltG n=1 Tax=Leucobacter insecticola TaxID=2714934 RepID=UPI00244E0BAF|nr:endolytic transglycosylase MltG [Leucobacter insecticola]
MIQNRLDKDMLLQMDSTAQYGMGQHEDGSVWSTDEALADDNPWNTYVHKGLPAGPISNPGRDAIGAALNPEPGIGSTLSRSTLIRVNRCSRPTSRITKRRSRS